MKNHIFMPYEHQTGADSGTGLGLAISHGLINLMGGTIGFRDTPGGGATFWIRIPASQITGDVPPRRWTGAHMVKA
jgi:signal transduction histidine kinase